MDLRVVFLVFATLIASALCSLSPLFGVDHYENGRPARDTPVVKIATAETDAKSDSEAGHGMASSTSTTKGSAAFVSKGSHDGKHRRSARDVEVAVADTDAKSDSKAGHGMAASSSFTKGNAAYVSKHHHGRHHRSARSLETVKIAIADTKAESDSKAKDGMALSSSFTKGFAAFLSKNHRRRSARATEKVEVAVANTDGHSDSAAKSPENEPEKKLYGAPKPHHHKEEHPAHPKENPAKVDHQVKEEGKDKENQEHLPKTSFFDLGNLKRIVAELASGSVNL